MEQQEYDKMSEWLKENQKLFPPTNSRPDEKQKEEMFYWANKLDPYGNHKPSGCGRCYYNARRAIIRKLQIF
jgi:hypothetical protein